MGTSTQLIQGALLVWVFSEYLLVRWSAWAKSDIFGLSLKGILRTPLARAISPGRFTTFEVRTQVHFGAGIRGQK